MQSEPLLLSSARSGVLKLEPILSSRDILLLFFGLVFVIFGAADLLSRVFAHTAAVPAITLGELATSTPDIFAAPFTPTRLSIPRLLLNASIESVGRKPDGFMRAPSRFDTVAWFNEGSLPGAAGNAVIAGHLNNAIDTSGVFEHLNELSLGDTIILQGENDREARYVVREMTVYDTAQAPQDTIFSTSGPSRIVLITCDGAWDQGKRSYDKRLVVYADLQSAH